MRAGPLVVAGTLISAWDAFAAAERYSGNFFSAANHLPSWMRRNPDYSRTSKLLLSCEQPALVVLLLEHIKHQWRSCGGTPRGVAFAQSAHRRTRWGTEKAVQVTGQAELVHPAAVRACALRAGSCRRTSSTAGSGNRHRQPCSFQSSDKM